MTTISPQVASVYGANAAPIATSATTLGVTNQPTTTGGNAAINTGYVSTPVPVVGSTTGGGASVPLTSLAGQQVGSAVPAAQQQIASMGASAANLTQGQQSQAATAAANIATQQLQTAATTSGGGVIGDALKSGVSSIVAFAQKGMADIQKAIQGDMAANNGEVDPAKMQLYTMKMSTYELLNQMAAKIQEKEERSIQVWLQR